MIATGAKINVLVQVTDADGNPVGHTDMTVRVVGRMADGYMVRDMAGTIAEPFTVTENDVL